MKGIEVTYIDHSGFMVETTEATLIFDAVNGNIPEIKRDKSLYVFASHAHGDHYTSRIFSWFDGGDGRPRGEFFLGDDRDVTIKRDVIPEEIRPLCHLMEGYSEKRIVIDGSDSFMLVETLQSTDAGVAFLVEIEDKTIFHAGDLAWWDWTLDGGDYDPKLAEEEAREAESLFKKCIEPLRGRHIDVAMLPLDPRLGGTTDWTIEAYDEICEIDHIFPMHQWGRYEVTIDFIRKHPDLKDRVMNITGRGAHFSL